MNWALPMHDWQDVEQGEGWLTSITGWWYPGFWFRSSLPFLCYERALLSFLAGILGMVGTESRNRVSHGNDSTILPNLMGSQASSFQALHRTLFLPLGSWLTRFFSISYINGFMCQSCFSNSLFKKNVFIVPEILNVQVLAVHFKVNLKLECFIYLNEWNVSAGYFHLPVRFWCRAKPKKKQGWQVNMLLLFLENHQLCTGGLRRE